MRFAGIVAVSSLELTKFVDMGSLFHSMTANEANPPPLIVNVNAGPPAAITSGLKRLIAGPAVIVNGKVFETPPSLVTETVAVPAVEMKLPDICALS